MITITLFHFGRTVAERTAETVKAAEAVIDSVLTDVLRDRHGHGEFQIVAVSRTDAGLMTTAYHYDSTPFDHPARATAASKPA